MSQDRNDQDKPGRAPSSNQGEGDRDSARRYNDHVREFVVYGDPEGKAREAADAIDGPEGPSLRAAEAAGKARSATSGLLEGAVGMVTRLRKMAGEVAHEVSARIAARRGARGGAR